MLTAIKVLAATMAVMLAFLGLPLLIVGTGALFVHWFGNTWYAGLLYMPFFFAEVFGGLPAVMWLGGKVGEWVGQPDN